MKEHTLFVEGVGFWAPTLPGWPEAKAAFLGAALPLEKGASIPVPTVLPRAERRRAPETLSLALAVSAEALQAAGRQPDEVLAVFTSAHGDLPAIDYLCDTLAHTPSMVSPTRFMHTIHNSPLGVWSMLAANGRNHTAVSAAECSFAAGLLEAAMLVETEQQPVLLVGYDTAATGALMHTTQSQGTIAVALLLSPSETPFAMARMHWCPEHSEAEASEPQSAAGRSLPPNGMSQALPMFEALAAGSASTRSMRLSGYQRLRISFDPLTPSAPT